ncbi:hypothetical protein LINGRAHAP2_LOCUS10373, partial [Linum grandiflorum]
IPLAVSGPIPAFVFSLTNLRILDLVGDSFSDQIPGQIGIPIPPRLPQPPRQPYLWPNLFPASVQKLMRPLILDSPE